MVILLIMKSTKTSLFAPILVSLAFLVFTGCNTDMDSSPDDSTNLVPDGMIGNTVFIDASSGGVVTLPVEAGGISLIIPPGALESSTDISVYTLPEATPGRIRLGFEPDGLEFLKPVRIKMSLSQELFDTYALSNMWNISDLNELVDVGSEQHRWTPLANVVVDPSGETMTGEMQHFSTGFVLLGIQRVAYMVVDLPGKYLRPGDGLFVMSAGDANYKYHWVPGHVGLINSVDPIFGNVMVIEATLGGGAAENINGVQTNPFLRFKRTAGHVYMGARRPAGKVFRDDQREKIVTFARGKLGTGYNLIGDALRFLDVPGITGWSCSSLVLAAWAEVGRNPLELVDLNFFPTPVEMFEATVPVSEISVKVGKEVKIPVYPVVIDKSSDITWSTGFYIAGNPTANAALFLGANPPESGWSVDNTHPYRARVFTWTPKPSDAGSTVTLNFEMRGSVALDAGYSKSYVAKQSLDIHVLGASTEIEIKPVGKGLTGLIYTHYFPMPDFAVVEPSSPSHLFDKATGAYPVNPVFKDQVLDRFDEGWLSPPARTHYGMRLHISRNDNPFDPAPPGSHTWIYWIDYDVSWYNGL